MPQYQIYIEEGEKPEILELNYTDLMISIVTSFIREAGENEKGDNLSKSIDGGAS